jgi:hypothetical protein
MGKRQFTVVVFGVIIFAGIAWAQESKMTLEEADRFFMRAGEFEPSYLSSEKAAEMFQFRGKLELSEYAQYGKTQPASLLLIKPLDQSFELIRIEVAAGNETLAEYAFIAANWSAVEVKEPNPFVPVQLADGAKGFYDGFGHIVVGSPDGSFEVSIEVTISEYNRDPTEKTNSNWLMVEGMENDIDHGLTYLKEAMAKLYPLARQRFQEQSKARSLLLEAQKTIDDAKRIQAPFQKH